MGFIVDVQVLRFDNFPDTGLTQTGNADQEKRPKGLTLVDLVQVGETYDRIEFIRPGFEVLTIGEGPYAFLTAQFSYFQVL